MTGSTRRKVTIRQLHDMKMRGECIVALGVYEAMTAAIADEIGIHLLMTGPSGPMSLFGHRNLAEITFEEQIVLTRAVSRGNAHALTNAHLPYLSYHGSAEEAVKVAARMVIEGGADTVKCDGNRHLAGNVAAIVRAGIPVIGHIGLQASRRIEQSGYGLKGATAAEAAVIVEDARALVEAGVFALLIENATVELAGYLAQAMPVPVIGLGSGSQVDGVCIVSADATGYSVFPKPKGIDQLVDVGPVLAEGLGEYRNSVKAGRYPDPRQTHAMARDELKAFQSAVSGTAEK